MFNMELYTNTHAIKGIGVDLIDQRRIQKIFFKYKDRFAEKILTQRELEFLPIQLSRKINFLAKRFSAKEAFSKALGTGLGKDFHFKDVEIFNHKTGQPYYEVHPAIRDRFHCKESFLSFSDENPYIISFCILIKNSS